MTGKQQKHINGLCALISVQEGELARGLAAIFERAGYLPRHKKSAGYKIEFYNPAVAKGIAKMRENKGKLGFALRFSASDTFSTKFAEAIRTQIDRNKTRDAFRCGMCMVCGTMPRVYSYRYEDDGMAYEMCGSLALWVDGVTQGDFDEIERLVEAQHAHFLRSAQKVAASME